MGGRRKHVNIDTTTCDPIVSMSKEKSVSTCVFFHKNKTHRGDRPSDSKGPNLAWVLPIDRRKGPEGRLPRLWKAVKVTAASNDCHPLKILEKGGEAHPVDAVFTRNIWNRLKTVAFGGEAYFSSGERPSQSSTAVKSYPDCSLNQFVLE